MVLFVSDGTPSGTLLIPSQPGFIDWLTPAGSFLYFSKTDLDHDNELWRWDGTQNAPVLVADIYPGPASSYPASLYPMTARVQRMLVNRLPTSTTNITELWIIRRGSSLRNESITARWYKPLHRE